ncbi:hypothetical protein GCM10008905_11910 [Clostridium malenominatum]|uniref:Uncharacterized protein n=1 Tax=Clostridium malenominatum TaxID=1539 RepID=A0ABN1IU79_9CLOT
MNTHGTENKENARHNENPTEETITSLKNKLVFDDDVSNDEKLENMKRAQVNRQDSLNGIF